MEIVGCLRRELVEEEEEGGAGEEEEGRPEISTTCLSIITQAKRQFLWSIIRVEHTHTHPLPTHTHTVATPWETLQRVARLQQN